MARYKFSELAFNVTQKKKPEPGDEKTYIGLEHLDSESIFVDRFGSETVPKGEKLVMKKGDVLFGKRRAYQKKVAIAPFDGIFSAHGMVLRPKEDVIDKDFFPMFIKSDYFLDKAIKISVGSLSPTINWRDLKDLEFELPNLTKQKKLAELLWAINDTKEQYKKLMVATDELVKAQFIEMFGDVYNQETEWKKNSFLNVIEDCSRQGTKITTNDYLNSGLYPIVDQGQDFICGYRNDKNGIFENVPVIIFGDHTRCFKYVDFPFFIGADGVKVLKIKKTDVNYRFLIEELKMAPIPNMGYNRHFRWLKEFDLFLPPLNMQNQFAAFVQQSDKSKFELKQAIESVDSLIRSLMQQELN